ncbi:MAG TPA: hypothetical protein VFJ58_24300 [Armatimonadota bacterium]|nr:hypothetical protein [Armatimonadota bacterium]
MPRRLKTKPEGGDLSKRSSKGSSRIGISRLKDVSIVFEEDGYTLAAWLLELDLAHSTAACIPRHTLHGLANCCAFLTDIEPSAVEKAFSRYGLPREGTIERDEDAK